MERKKRKKRVCANCRNGCYRFVLKPLVECAKRSGTGGRSCLMEQDEGCSNFEARAEGEEARLR